MNESDEQVKRLAYNLEQVDKELQILKKQEQYFRELLLCITPITIMSLVVAVSLYFFGGIGKYVRIVYGSTALVTLALIGGFGCGKLIQMWLRR